MNWKNTFEVHADPDTVFSTLVDIPTIAPCMPGAQLTGTTDGGAYEGTVKVRLGPITAQYKGKARLTESDASERRAVLVAEGSETRGQGTAAATITAVCVEMGALTRVDITTDLKITGKVASFGRGVLQDVSGKLIGQFADCLSTKVLAGGGSDAAAADAAADSEDTAGNAAVTGSAQRAAAPETHVAPIDLGKVAGPALRKRLVPLLVAAGLVAFLIKILRTRRAS